MWAGILDDAGRHALLCAQALALATAIGAPLAAFSAERARMRALLLALAAVGRTLPSIAVLTLLIPLLGVGTAPALVALVLLALPPIVINVDLAIRGVAPAARDAALGLGMSRAQCFGRIVAPLALPVALAGVRTASVEVIASATLATFIGAGGLGDDIVRALQTDDLPLLVAASATVAAMAFVAELLFARTARAIEVRTS